MDIRALQKLGAGIRLKSVLLHLRITAGITEIKKNKIERAYGRVRIVCVLVCSGCVWGMGAASCRQQNLVTPKSLCEVM